MISPRIAVVAAFSMFVSCSSQDDDDDETSTMQAVVTFPSPLVKDVGGAMVGTLPGSFAVTADGAATYSIPIDVAPGRAGIQPSLELSYSSRNGNGHLGVGWQLSGLSEIRRCGPSLRLDAVVRPVHFDDNDRYCLDGKELVAISGHDGADGTTYRTDPDTFSKITSTHAATDACGQAATSVNEPTSFTVSGKDGRIFEYGTTCDALGIAMEHPLVDTAGTHGAVIRRFSWALKTVRDRSGNFMTYTYGKSGWSTSDGPHSQLPDYEASLTSIDYTASSSTAVPAAQRAALRRISFSYEGRSDVTTGYMHGLAFHMTNRLRFIGVQAPTAPTQSPAVSWLRTYWLSYDQAPSTNKSRLISVQECNPFGANGSGITDATQCLPATKLAYSNMVAPTFAHTTITGENIDTAFPTFNTRLFTAADVNNDGRDDLIYKSLTTNTLFVRPGGPSGPGAATNTGVGQPWAEGRAAPILIYDVTGNGAVDIVEQDEQDVCEDACLGPNIPSNTQYEIPIPTYRINVHNSTSSGGTISFGSNYSLGSDFSHWQYHPLGLELFELNGDGVRELRWNRQKTTGFPPKYNGGDTDTIQFSDGTVSTHDVILAPPSSSNPKPFILADIDGDGVPETITAGPYGDRNHAVTNWSATNTESRITNLQSDTDCTVFADLNGDGLADAVNVRAFNGTNQSFVQLSYGNGEFSTPVPVGTAHFQGLSCTGYNDSGVRVVDWDRDGRQDLLLLGRTKLDGGVAYLLRWTGSGFTETAISSLALVGGVGDDWNAPTPVQVDSPGAVIADFNGDGAFDIAMNGGSYIDVYMQNVQYPDLLVSVTDGTQRLVRAVSYGVLDPSNYSPSTTRLASERIDYPRAVVVTKEWFPDPSGGGASPSAETAASGEVDHGYSGALTDTRGDGWLGFARHSTYDLRDGSYRTTTYSQELRTYTPTNTDRYAFKQLPVEEVSTISSGTTVLATRTRTTWDWHTRTVHNPATSADHLVYFAFPSVSTVEQFESPTLGLFAPDFTNQHPYRTTITRTLGVDDLGNVTKDQVDEGGTSMLVTTTSRAFTQEDTNAWLIGRVTQECVNSTATGVVPADPCVPSTDTTKNATHKTTYTYASGTRLVQDTVRQPSTPDARTSHVSRDLFGQVAQVDVTANVHTCPSTQVAQTRTTTTTYDTTRDSVAVTATSQRRDAGTMFITKLETDPATGLVYGITDPNNAVTTRQYDGFGRPYKVIRSDGSTETITRGATGNSMWTSSDRGPDGVSTVYTDRLGHAARAATRRKDGAIAYTDSFYDSLGRLDHVLRPYYSADPNRYDAIRNTYDKASRVTKACHPTESGGTACAYVAYGLDGNYQRIVTTTDEDGDAQKLQLNHAGLVAASYVYPDAILKGTGPSQTTAYSYGPFGQLASVVDPALHAQTLTYDALGRRIGLDDPDIGHVADTFNGFNEIETETDATTTTTCIEHDALGRLSRRVAPDGIDQFDYDTAPGAGKGRIAKKTRGAISTTYAYTTVGQVQTETWEVDGQTFAFDYTYDLQGHRQTMTYPAANGQTQRMQIQETYQNGFLQSIKDVGANRLVWTAGPMDADGHVTTETLANGLVTTNAYFPQTGRIQSISTPAIPYTPHLVSYTYTANGDVATRTSRIGGPPYPTTTDKTETFTYDGFHRLTSSQVAGQPKFDFAYDALGNMTKLTDTLPGCTLAFSAAHPHQLASYTCGSTTSAMTYDARGNTLSYDDGDTFQAHLAYTSFDKLASTDTKFGTIALTYDADHRRIKKQPVSIRYSPPAGGNLTNMWGTTISIGPFEKRSPSPYRATTDFVNQVVANGHVVAERYWMWNGSTGTQEWHYLHHDALGTVERVSADDKTAIDWGSYDAWGTWRDWTESGGALAYSPRFPGLGFAGHEALWESGYGNLVDMGARQYHSWLHRFLQPDTVMQGQNRYAYALHNPLRYVDPSGHLAMDRTAIPVQYTCTDCLGGGWGVGIGGGLSGVSIDSMGNLVTQTSNGELGSMTALDASRSNDPIEMAATSPTPSVGSADSHTAAQPSIFDYGVAGLGNTPAPAMPATSSLPLGAVGIGEDGTPRDEDGNIIAPSSPETIVDHVDPRLNNRASDPWVFPTTLAGPSLRGQRHTFKVTTGVVAIGSYSRLTDLATGEQYEGWGVGSLGLAYGTEYGYVYPSGRNIARDVIAGPSISASLNVVFSTVSFGDNASGFFAGKGTALSDFGLSVGVSLSWTTDITPIAGLSQDPDRMPFWLF